MVLQMKKQTKILIGLDDTENKVVTYYKTAHSLITKEDAIKKIIRQIGKTELLPDIEKDLKK